MNAPANIQIPADVLEAARQAIAERVGPEARGQYLTGRFDHFAVIQALCAAILAERQRFVAEFDGAADAGIDAAIAAERERCAALVDTHIAAAERCQDAPIWKHGVPMCILIQDLRELRDDIAGKGDA